MEQRKQRIALLVCLVLFAVCGAVSLLFSESDAREWTDAEGVPVVISEILPSNRTYPAPDGRHLDFVEVHNLSGDAVDISGFMLSDDLRSIGYTFPGGTVLPAYGYAVCWCDPDSGEGDYAAFRISRDGGETVYLYNSANVLIDEKEVPPVDPNIALVRADRENWKESGFATPGYPNTEEGYSQWLRSAPGGELQVEITEVMTDNSCFTTEPGAKAWDWVELTNRGNDPAVLTGAYLSNDPADPLKWQIPELTIAPGASAVVYCAGTQTEGDKAPFALSKTGCSLILTGQLGNTLSRVDCPDLLTDHTWELTGDGSWRMTDRPTPGFENTEAGFSAWLSSVGGTDMPVVISEIMASNRSTLLGSKGQLADWVELTNTGNTPVCLDGAYLSDDPGERGKWAIGQLTLEPGQSAVIFCAGSDAGAGEADFALSASGCTVVLSGSMGNLIDQVSCPALEPDRVWALQEDGSYRQTDMPTPGSANSHEEYLSWAASRRPLGALAVTEVMASNDRYLIQSDGRYYDWVELTNVSDQNIELSDYSLSDSPEAAGAFRLPQRVLKPGERVVVICSAREDLVGRDIHAPFTLSAEECWVYVTHSSGAYSDYLRIYEVQASCSMGRGEDGGICRFAQPTPGRENGEGTFETAPIPTVLTEPGIYNGVSALTVELTGQGTIRYTTDGSEPTQEDPVYTGPLTFTRTTVLRAAAWEEGKLKSPVLTAGYVINEAHTLPVLSLAADPEALFGGEGIYGQSLPADEEIPCSLSLFEAGGGFSLDCGLEMMATGTAYPEKKSMKVNFRGGYGSSVLGYPLFGEDGPRVFDALCLQAGGEQGMTLFRDELFTQLCLELTDSVPVRHYKFCVLYINGEYYGIYSLREEIGQMLYSQAMTVAAEDVELAEEPVAWGSELYELARYCGENDLTDAEAFAYFEAQMDTESLIDWMILQGYCCNAAVGEDLRWFRTPETGNRWQPGFFDPEGGFTDRCGFAEVLKTGGTYGYTRFARSIAENSQTRQAFLERLGEALDTVLSPENVLARIDGFEALLAPEIRRERERWGSDAGLWQADVDRLRLWLTRYDHGELLIQSLRETMGLTEEEAELIRCLNS